MSLKFKDAAQACWEGFWMGVLLGASASGLAIFISSFFLK